MSFTGRLMIIGGSDAGIAAALRARERAPIAEVTVLVADEFPNFSICGLPYWLGGEVGDWHDLAHRTIADLEASGMPLRLATAAVDVDPTRRRVSVRNADDMHDERISPRDRQPWTPSPAARMTAMIFLTVGGSAG